MPGAYLVMESECDLCVWTQAESKAMLTPVRMLPLYRPFLSVHCPWPGGIDRGVEL
jgi:hypothetical protein